MVAYNFDLQTTDGIRKFEFFECVSEGECLPKSREVDYILEFISPDEIEDTLTIERESIKRDFPNVKNYVIVVSKADLLSPPVRKLLEKDPNVVVLSTREGTNLYEPIEKALNEEKPELGPYFVLITGPGKTSWLTSLVKGKYTTSYEGEITTNKGKITFVLLSCSYKICQALEGKADGIIQIVTGNSEPLEFEAPTINILSRDKNSLTNEKDLLENTLLDLAREILQDPKTYIE